MVASNGKNEARTSRNTTPGKNLKKKKSAKGRQSQKHETLTEEEEEINHDSELIENADVEETASKCYDPEIDENASKSSNPDPSHGRFKKEGINVPGKSDNLSTSFISLEDFDNKNSISQAEMHIRKMPKIEDDGKYMAVWTDIKEIIFPSCSDSRCDIVIDVIKRIFDYPNQEINASPCTPKQQMAFLKNFRIVPCGTLLVNTRTILDKIEILQSMVQKSHITSVKTSSKECHYAREHHDHLLSPDRHVTTEFQQLKSIANNKFCWRRLPLSQVKDIFKGGFEFDPIIYNGKYLIPAMMLDSRPYVPMSLIHPYFRQFYSFLFDLSRDYLVGTGSEIIRCMSLLEANCLSSYMAWKQGWGARWRHITSRDLMINWEKLSEYVENPPPVLNVESSDLFNNVLVRNPLQMLCDTEKYQSKYTQTDEEYFHTDHTSTWINKRGQMEQQENRKDQQRNVSIVNSEEGIKQVKMNLPSSTLTQLPQESTRNKYILFMLKPNQSQPMKDLDSCIGQTVSNSSIYNKTGSEQNNKVLINKEHNYVELSNKKKNSLQSSGKKVSLLTKGTENNDLRQKNSPQQVMKGKQNSSQKVECSQKDLGHDSLDNRSLINKDGIYAWKQSIGDQQHLIRDPEQSISDQQHLIRDPEQSISDQQHLIRDPEQSMYDQQHLIRDPEQSISDQQHLIRDPEQLIYDQQHLMRDPEQSIYDWQHLIRYPEQSIYDRQHLIRDTEQSIKKLHQSSVTQQNKNLGLLKNDEYLLGATDIKLVSQFSTDQPLLQEIEKQDEPPKQETEKRDEPPLQETEKQDEQHLQETEKQDESSLHEPEKQDVPPLQKTKKQDKSSRQETEKQYKLPVQETEKRDEPPLQETEKRDEPPLRETEKQNELPVQETEKRDEPPLRETEKRDEPPLRETEKQNELPVQETEKQDEPPLQETEKQDEPPLQETEKQDELPVQETEKQSHHQEEIEDQSVQTCIAASSQSINKKVICQPKGVHHKDEIHLPVISKSCHQLPSHQRKVDLLEKPRRSVSTPVLASKNIKYRVKNHDLKLTFIRIKEKDKRTKVKKNSKTIAGKENKVDDESKTNKKEMITTDGSYQKEKVKVTTSNQRKLTDKKINSKTANRNERLEENIDKGEIIETANKEREAMKKLTNQRRTTGKASSKTRCESLSTDLEIETEEHESTKQKQKVQKSKKNKSKSSLKQNSETRWIVEDEAEPLKGYLKSKQNMKSKDVKYVTVEELQDIIERDWALQGSAYILNDDEESQGDTPVVRRSLRSFLTPSKPAQYVEYSDDDEIIDKKKVYTSSKKVRGRRSKLTKKQKFKLANVSSDDSLYEPELSFSY